MTVRVSEIFLSIEGEGPYTGRPTLFVRLFGCNFTCPGFGQPLGEIKPITYTPVKSLDDIRGQLSVGCDSAYSWHPAFKNLSTDWKEEDLLHEIINLTQDLPGHPVLSFTGGEPMLYQDFMAYVIEHGPRLNGFNFDTVLIETNGSIPMLPGHTLSNALWSTLLDVSFSISPKLSNSGMPLDKTINPAVVSDYFCAAPSSYLKFVSDGTQESFDEIDWAMSKYTETPDFNGFAYSVFIMPVGAETEIACPAYKSIAGYCISRGYTYCARVHSIIFGNKAGT